MKWHFWSSKISLWAAFFHFKAEFKKAKKLFLGVDCLEIRFLAWEGETHQGMGNFFSPRSFFSQFAKRSLWLELPFSEKKVKMLFHVSGECRGTSGNASLLVHRKKWNKPVPFSRILNGLNENYNFVSLEQKMWKEKKTESNGEKSFQISEKFYLTSGNFESPYLEGGPYKFFFI